MNLTRLKQLSGILTEMPVVGDIPSHGGMFNGVIDTIKTYDKHYPNSTQDLNNGLKKKVISDQIHYWYEKDGVILLVIHMVERDGNLVTQEIVKNPKHKGSPYASDLYSAIRKDQPANVKIISDKSLTEDGFQVWKRLLASGHKIGVIVHTDKTKTIKPIKSVQELTHYFFDDDEKNDEDEEDDPEKVSSFVLLR